MSLVNYQSLQKASTQNAATLGVMLPVLRSGGLDITSKQQTLQETLSSINKLSPNQGWVMFRDSLSITNRSPDGFDFIEAEYSNGDDSILIKLLGNNLYSVCFMNWIPDTDNMVYKTQELCIRNDLGKNKRAVYRVWYAQSDSNNLGRWEALTQQFIGFVKEGE